MSQQPRLLVRGPTIDFDDVTASPEPEKDSEKIHFIRHDTRTPSPTGDYYLSDSPNPRQREFSRMKKGDVELLQMVNAGYATASLLVEKDKTSDKGLTAPALDQSSSPTRYKRSERSAAKTMRQTKDQSSVDQVDTVTIINDLVSLSQNSPSGASPLHYAQTSRSFSTHVTDTLIEEFNIDINITDNDGDTALHWAVTHSHLENIELLISRGANENICNQSEEAPIHLAIKSGKVDVAYIFFSLKCDRHILYSYRGRNYLHLACEENNIEMVKLILKYSPKGRPGSDALDLPVPLVTLLDHDNLTPIHTAAKKCDSEILDLLLHQVDGAQLKESTLLSESREGFTPLHYSVDAGNLNNVKLLLRHGASPLTASRQQQISSIHLAAITSNTYNEILTELIMWTQGYDPTIVDIRDSQDRAPLHYAATYNHVQSASILHNYGANLNSIDRDGNTPLIVAASKGATKVLQFLLDKGADVTAQNHKGQTALLVSIEEGHWKTARELLTCPDEESKSVLVIIPDDTGQTPLHVICKGSGDYKTMSMLLELHADVNMHDRNRRIPLHYACYYGSNSMSYKLLQEGVWGSMLNDVDYRGHTSLHMAAREGHLEIIKLLLQKGAHITRSLDHDSAFSLACKHGHLKCAQLLYKTNNTMLNWQNVHGHTALHLAAGSGRKDTVLWLLDINSLLLWDNTQKSFADIAIERKEQSLMSAVLGHNRWGEVMKLNSPAAPPPFVSLVQFLPDLAKVILERAITKSSEPPDHKDYYERVNFTFLLSNTSQEQRTPRTLSGVSKQLKAKRNMSKMMSNNLSTRWKTVSQETKPVTPVKKSIISRIKSHYTLSNLLRSRYVYEESSLYALHVSSIFRNNSYN
ncbi:Transient receptor potential cation channel subfamily A member 1 [Oopsacas minuta]|uniref:Transient receptor potential cation channel subfamily A member 1 n=1 Tax=Oopsacas minuta TaxID=111878 RepID=A0AAV7KFU9_9METZ|nr:Transient receptor potential cation channel subfamily A member 1 [Oopsacas minuta]